MPRLLVQLVCHASYLLSRAGDLGLTLCSRPADTRDRVPAMYILKLDTQIHPDLTNSGEHLFYEVW
jgi:hypothetical protein